MQPTTDTETLHFYRVMAPYYDADHAPLYAGRDIELFCDLARRCGGPVLDMGCGTGRVLLPLARAGIEVWGVDASTAMLGRLRALLTVEPEELARISLLQGDIRHIDIGRRFPMILAAGHVLHSMLEREDQRAWLRNVRRHLADDGELVFDTFQFDYKRLAAPPQWEQDVDRVDPVTGRHIRRFVLCEHEPVFQRFRVNVRWLIEDDAGVVREDDASIMQRWFTRAELENLLELEGFRVFEYYGSFGGAKFGEGTCEFLQVIRACMRR